MGDETPRSEIIPDKELDKVIGGIGTSTGIVVPSRTLQRATPLGEAESVRNMTYKGNTSSVPLDLPDPPSSY